MKESEDAQSCLTLCDPLDCSLSGSSLHGILRAGVLEWVGLDSVLDGKKLWDTKTTGNFGKWTWEVCMPVKSLHLHLILCYPMDCSLPGSPVHGTLQARRLEWVAMPSSGRSFRPRDLTPISLVSCLAGRFFFFFFFFLLLSHQGSTLGRCYTNIKCPEFDNYIVVM